MPEENRIQLFGGMRITINGEEIDHFDGRKYGAMLAYIAYFNTRLHTRSSVIELIWPGGDSSAARGSLRQALSTIRREIEDAGGHPDNLITVNHTSIRLVSNVFVDTTEFDRLLAESELCDSEFERVTMLRKAVDLYRGDLLPGFDELWILGERRRMAESALGAMRRISQFLESHGDFEGALDYALRAVSADIAREESHLSVMQLYVAAGQPAAALRQYKELERALKSQLDELPSPSAMSLAAAIRKMPSTQAYGGDNHTASYNVVLSSDLGDVAKSDILQAPQRPWAITKSYVKYAVAVGWIAIALLFVDIWLRIIALKQVNPSAPAFSEKAGIKHTFQGGLNAGVSVNGKIVCEARHENIFDLNILDTATGQIKCIVAGQPEASYPSWSPDGQRILYVARESKLLTSTAGSFFSICIVDADGNNKRTLVSRPAAMGWPRWSPDGRKILFCSQHEGGWQIYSMQADGSHEMRLTKTEVRETSPSWSPDGKQIIWSSERTGIHCNSIWIMNSDGSNPRQLNSGKGVCDLAPSFSPDSNHIVFVRSSPKTVDSFNVYTMDIRGSHVLRLTKNLEEADSPHWTADGKQIVYGTQYTGNHEICVMNADGSNQRPVTATPNYEFFPDVARTPPQK